MTDGYLKDFDFLDLAVWMSCFAEPVKVLYTNHCEGLNNGVCEAIQSSVRLSENLGTSINTQNARLVHCWITRKSVAEIVSSIERFQFGSFVKLILRLISMLEEFKKLLHGFSEYRLENELDDITEKLTDSIVTNKSLYIEHL